MKKIELTYHEFMRTVAKTLKELGIQTMDAHSVEPRYIRISDVPNFGKWNVLAKNLGLEPCEHPKGLLLTSYPNGIGEATCGSCGVNLKAKWVVADDDEEKA